MSPRLLRLTPVVAALVLAGCASVSPDGLRSAVTAHTEGSLPAGSQLPTAPQARAAARAQMAAWLQQPVDADTAVRIALLNNPALQAQVAALGVADAQRVQALTLPNPTLPGALSTPTSARSSASSALAWSAHHPALAQPLAGLADGAGHADGRPAGAAAAADTPRLAARRGRAAGSGATTLHEAAAAGGELAPHGAVGNFSKLEQAQELRVQQQAAANLARARLNARWSASSWPA
jgi:hypothetical protein